MTGGGAGSEAHEGTLLSRSRSPPGGKAPPSSEAPAPPGVVAPPSSSTSGQEGGAAGEVDTTEGCPREVCPSGVAPSFPARFTMSSEPPTNIKTGVSSCSQGEGAEVGGVAEIPTASQAPCLAAFARRWHLLNCLTSEAGRAPAVRAAATAVPRKWWCPKLCERSLCATNASFRAPARFSTSGSYSPWPTACRQRAAATEAATCRLAPACTVAAKSWQAMAAPSPPS